MVCCVYDVMCLLYSLGGGEMRTEVVCRAGSADDDWLS
jgi:hypothetical protein